MSARSVRRASARRAIAAAIGSLCLVAPLPAAGPAGDPDDLAPFFAGYDGCFVMLDVETGAATRHDPAQCARRLSPCSTFKIPNSLIALETRVAADAEFALPWDGTTRGRAALNRDHTMRSAFADSVVWYYQEIASRIGAERMAGHLKAMEYGNQDLSGGLTQFWLESSLRISADEQVEFLRRLHRGDLPLAQRSMDVVQEIMVLARHGTMTYRGKTGSCRGREGGAGWFVGSVVVDGRARVFATNVVGDGADGRLARSITESLLRELGLLREDDLE